MFTGLVEARSVVRRTLRRNRGMRIAVAKPRGWRLARGRSIAVSGACLTLVSVAPDLMFDLSAETLARTSLGKLRAGDRVNLERAMRLSDRLDGHLVSGHVDGVGRIARIRDARDGGRLVTFEVERSLARCLVDKGSIAIDGISLTVVKPRGRAFDVAVIAETLRKTTLGRARAGDRVNVEVDLVAKWLGKLSQRAR